MSVDHSEVERLKQLVATARLTASEHAAIERQIDELEKPEPAPAKYPGVLGVFDRPAPSRTEPPTPSPTIPSAAEVKASANNDIEPAPPETPAQPELSPKEADELAERISDIANRIVWMQSFWARTVSVEVDREIQAWLAKLQELAKKLPPELVESTLGTKAQLLTAKVRDIRKETISQNVQLWVLPPSAPSLDSAGVWADLYFAIHEPRAPRPLVHPPGYVPDGLQSWVA
jgi:uncharacterized protein YukE